MAQTRSNRAKQKNRRVTSQNGQSQTKLKDLKSKPDSYLECRSYTYHGFVNIGGLYYWRDETGSGIARLSECKRGCGMLREDFYNSRGVRVYRRYYPPEDYALEGEGKVTNADVMGELIRRATSIAPSRDDLPGAKRILRLVDS